MNAPGFDATFLAACRNANLTAGQELFLQTVVRRIDPDSLLGHHSSVLRGLSLDIPQALGAIDSYRSIKEPRAKTVQSLCQSAAAAANRAMVDHHSSIASDVINAVSLVGVVGSGINGTLNDQDVVSAQTALRAIEARLPAYLNDIFTRVWERAGGPGGAAVAVYGADEIAAAAAMNDRDGLTLQQDLIRLFNGGGWTTADVFSVLIPPQRLFKHACVILGASELTDLPRLAAGAVQLSGRAATRPAWGPATDALKKWLDGLSIIGEGIVISLDVHACDRASAARRGQQAATELLDQYMAGHRVSVIELSSEAFTCEAGSARGAQMNPPSRGVSVARPLIEHWPIQLRSTMRMAHLSRLTGAPLVSAALAWSAVEASGLGPADMPSIARVLALQSLRHQVAAAHVGLLHDVRARRKYWQSQYRTNSEALARNAGLLDIMGAEHPGRASVESLHASHSAAATRAQTAVAAVDSVEDGIKTLAVYCTTRHHAVLEDFNTWVDVLLPERVGDSESLRDARLAVKTATLEASAMACEALESWRSRLASPRLLASWLTETELTFERLLISMYASRNMTMHSGVFATPGDVVLGRGAQLVADVMMEVLGNWYRHNPTAVSGGPDAPRRVIQHLATRYDDLCSKMNQANSPAYALNVAWLTGPGTPDGWDRPPR